jgi:hypothetical protein
MRFPYLAQHTRQPIYPLGRATVRAYPVCSTSVSSPRSALARDGLVDSGADDTIFPSRLAPLLGIDLTNAPLGSAHSVSGAVLTYRYAHVTLRISDGLETCEWPAIVGFYIHLRWLIFGQTGFLEFFDAQLLGARRELVLTPNASFPGQHTVH